MATIPDSLYLKLIAVCKNALLSCKYCHRNVAIITTKQGILLMPPLWCKGGGAHWHLKNASRVLDVTISFSLY